MILIDNKGVFNKMMQNKAEKRNDIITRINKMSSDVIIYTCKVVGAIIFILGGVWTFLQILSYRKNRPNIKMIFEVCRNDRVFYTGSQRYDNDFDFVKITVINKGQEPIIIKEVKVNDIIAGFAGHNLGDPIDNKATYCNPLYYYVNKNKLVGSTKWVKSFLSCKNISSYRSDFLILN